MLYALRYIAIVAAITAPAVSLGQTQIPIGVTSSDLIVRAGYNDLETKDKRRLDFYAEKIVVEILAVASAKDESDTPAFRQHGMAMKTTAERFLVAANKSGLTEPEADTIFRRHLIDGFSGALPSFMVTDTGIAGVRDLLTLEVGAQETGGGDYVDSIRDAGESLFGN